MIRWLSQEVGFVTWEGLPERTNARTIGVGMLGYAFMGKAHANAYRKIPYMTWPPPLVPRLVAVAGRTEEAVAEAARRYGFEGYATDWRDLVSNDEVELFDNSGPNNLHAEPTIAAAEAGKHVICEKPLARTADESYEVWQRVAAAGVKHMCAFNYRFVPAVRLAREMLEAGDLGDIYHFRGSYLQEWGDIDDQVWRFERATAGSGALGDLGAHVIDLAAISWARSSRSAAERGRSSRGATSTTPSKRSSSSKAARSGRWRRHASVQGARTRSPGRSTAPRARSHSTSSA